MIIIDTISASVNTMACTDTERQLCDPFEVMCVDFFGHRFGVVCVYMNTFNRHGSPILTYWFEFKKCAKNKCKYTAKKATTTTTTKKQLQTTNCYLIIEFTSHNRYIEGCIFCSMNCIYRIVVGVLDVVNFIVIVLFTNIERKKKHTNSDETLFVLYSIGKFPINEKESVVTNNCIEIWMWWLKRNRMNKSHVDHFRWETMSCRSYTRKKNHSQ